MGRILTPVSRPTWGVTTSPHVRKYFQNHPKLIHNSLSFFFTFLSISIFVRHGGIGKTTIARAVYNLIGDKFEALCFLSDVREISNKHGLSYLQETLLAEVVQDKDIKLRGDVNKGVSIIKHRLNRKKVLLVLDDVDKQQQLQALAGSCNWFGCGSRIIITTRDKHLLARHGVEKIYEVKKLNDEEALQLFSWNASAQGELDYHKAAQLFSLNSFREDEVPLNYLGISKRLVLYCSGLPLALEVIGSNFWGKGIDEWNSALNGYEKSPDTKIFKVLKLSYDTLGDIEKQIFLDVACFFKGVKLEDVKDMQLSVRDINSEHAIGVLVDKSLLKIEYGHVTMHDLTQDMGKEIVRQESPKEPGGRSRLWFYEDILHVLQQNTGTDTIEVLILDLPKSKEVHWSGKAFKKMKNLKMLIVKNASFTSGPSHLPNSLRVLDWSYFPENSLPSNFHPTNLYSLNLSNNCFLLLKPFTKNFESLNVMNFKSTKYLTQVPDFSGVPNLKKLCLDDCTSLTEVHDLVGFLSKLKVLSAERCTNLRTFPHSIKLTSLELLRLSWCSSLQSFPEVLDKMEKTRELSLSGTAIEELPYSIHNLIGLQMLDLVECKHLRQLPTSILRLPELWILGAKLCRDFRHFIKCKDEEEGVSSVLPSKMTLLSLSKCNLSNESLSMCLSCFPNLTYLDLSFNSFTILPACIKGCHLLRDLSVENCKQLVIIEEMPPNLETFKAKNCESLTSLSSSMLLNQAFHKPGRRKFIIPGQKFPEWFHHYSDGESMCFWVRDEFPALVVCVVVGVLEDKDCTFNLKLSVRINGNDQMFYGDQGLLSTLVIDHIFLFDLQSELFKSELQKLLLKDELNRVEVLCMNDSWIRLKGGVIKWTGVHVYKQGNNMENIQFSRPNPPKRTCLDLFNSNYDLEQRCYPLMKKQRTSLDIRVNDCKSPDLQVPRRHSLNLSSTGCETVSEQQGKNLLVNNNNSGTILDHPSKSQPENQVTRFHMSSNIQSSTASLFSANDSVGELNQTTIIDCSPRNYIEPTVDDEEMVKFYSDLPITRQNEETLRALEVLQDFLSKDFASLLYQGQYNTMKTTLDYLSNLSADSGISLEMRSVISELLREFTHWSRDYADSSRKIEVTSINLLRVDRLEESLEVNRNCFWEVKGIENDLCNELVNLKRRKQAIVEQINAIEDNISVSESAKEMAGKRKREFYEAGKMLKAQSDELRQHVPRLRDEQESARKIQAKIEAEWSKLAGKFNKGHDS